MDFGEGDRVRFSGYSSLFHEMLLLVARIVHFEWLTKTW